MNNTLVGMIGKNKPLYGKSETALYVKFVQTLNDWGLGLTLYVDHEEDFVSWELAIRLLCWQVWIGR